MSDWVKVTNDEFEVGIEIATLKKGELQIKYAKDIVAKDKEIERLNKAIIIMEKYLELIYDLGCDNDGFETTGDLVNLIGELTRYASLGRVCNTTEPIFVNGNKKYNILNEELKGDSSNE